MRKLAQSGKVGVVCSQGDVIPALLCRLGSADDVDIPRGGEAEKAGTWALSFDGSRLFGVEYFPALGSRTE